MSGNAFGSIELAQAALMFVLLLVLRRQWMKDGAERERLERAGRRALHRTEARTPRGRHHLAPFPGDDELFERKPADTGELRALSAMAEAGELDRIRGENAAFFRTWDLRQWTRKRETAA